jgi:hypothetical protein
MYEYQKLHGDIVFIFKLHRDDEIHTDCRDMSLGYGIGIPLF